MMKTLLRFLKFKKAIFFQVLLAGLFFSTLFFFGYFATYDLLLIDQGLQDFSVERTDGQLKPFMFKGYKWLRGIDLNPAGGTSNSFTLYPVKPICERPLDVKLYICSSNIPPQSSGSQPRVVIKQCSDETREFSFPLSHLNGQESVSFCTQLDEPGIGKLLASQFTFRLEGLDGPLPPDSEVLLSTHINISYVKELTLCFLGLSVSGAFLWMLNRRLRRYMAIAAFCLITLGVFRMGMFISNDFCLETSGQASVFKTSFGHFKRFAATGEFYGHVYKRPAHYVVPAISLALEPVRIPTKYYVDTWPTPRYITFCMEVICVSLLVAVLYFHLSSLAGILYPFVHCCFVPFLFDFYNMEDDALLLMLSLPLTALLLYSFIKDRFTWRVIASYCLLFFLMTLCKVTFAFYCLSIPFAFYIKDTTKWKDMGHLCKTALLFGALIVTVFLGNLTAKLVAPKGEAQPGYPYHSSNLFDMLWAANGLFDHDTGHPFIKSGRERDRVVGEAAGLPEDQRKRMRHAAIGDALVYKPDLKNALQTRPTFYLNNAGIRFWYYASNFWGYPDRGNYWRLDEERSNSAALGQNVFNEEEGGGRSYKTLVYRSRFEPTWKIMPQIFVTSLFNLDGTGNDRLLDLLLLTAACVGLILTKNRSLVFIFLSSYGFKVIFNTFIHGKVRYFNFVHPAMIVGICLFLAAVYVSLARSKTEKTD